MTSDINENIDKPAGEMLNSSPGSGFMKYAELAAGKRSFFAVVNYDLITGIFGPWPGMSGFVLRRVFYRMVLNHVGKGVTIARNVTFRGAAKVSLGDRVFVDERCMIAARGKDASVVIENDVLLACNTIVRSRGGELIVGQGSSIGSNCILATDSRLVVGKDVLLGAYTYLCAGGSHKFDDKNIPVIRQSCESKGGVSVGDGAWIGAHTTVLDGAKIGAGAVVGANSLVKTELPDMSVSYGTPARIQKQR